MEKIKKIGYAQVEPHRLAAQATKSIFGQLPLDSAVLVAENGMGLVYDQVAGGVRLPKVKGEYVELHMSEINLVDERLQEDKDFAIVNHAETQFQTAMAAHPRMFPLTVGDKFTTNAIKVTDLGTDHVAGDRFAIDVDGYWVPIAAEEASLVLRVIKPFTLADGQKALQFVVDSVDVTGGTN